MGSPNLRNTVDVMQGIVADQLGNLIANPWVRVYDHVGALADLYANYDGDVTMSTPLANPFQGEPDGEFRFYTTSGPCTVEIARDEVISQAVFTYDYVMLGAIARVDQNNVFEGNQTFTDVRVTGDVDFTGYGGSPFSSFVHNDRTVTGGSHIFVSQQGSPHTIGTALLTDGTARLAEYIGSPKTVVHAAITVNAGGLITAIEDGIVYINSLADVTGSPRQVGDIITWETTGSPPNMWRPNQPASALNYNYQSQSSFGFGYAFLEEDQMTNDVTLRLHENIFGGIVSDFYGYGPTTNLNPSFFNNRFVYGSGELDPTNWLYNTVIVHVPNYGLDGSPIIMDNIPATTMQPIGMHKMDGWMEATDPFGGSFGGPTPGNETGSPQNNWGIIVQQIAYQELGSPRGSVWQAWKCHTPDGFIGGTINQVFGGSPDGVVGYVNEQGPSTLMVNFRNNTVYMA